MAITNSRPKMLVGGASLLGLLIVVAGELGKRPEQSAPVQRADEVWIVQINPHCADEIPTD